MWLRRFIDRFRGTAPTDAGGAQATRVREVLLKHSAYDDEAEFLAAVLASLAGEKVLQEGTLRSLIFHLRGHYGEELSKIGDEVEAHLVFWKALADQFDHPLARACHADTLLLAGNDAEAMELFLGVFERHPTLLYEFGGDLLDVARALGGEHWLSYQLACLRAALADYQDTGDDDYIREIYSELLEDYAGNGAALEHIRALGKAIDDAVAQGKLPRALVRRGVSRRRESP